MARKPKQVEIHPNARQTQALFSPADILFFGGAAGGGKSYYLLMEALRRIDNPRFQAVLFRRTNPMLEMEGGLWEKSVELYPHAGGQPIFGKKLWKFPSGATVRMTHMEHEKNMLDWNSSQIPLIEFDEVTEFTLSMFLFMLSRNRSTCGVRPYFRAACNPLADSWVAEFIKWWIDQDTGFPINERAGVLRWVARIDEKLEWADSWAELHARFPLFLSPPGTVEAIIGKPKPLSVTFIPSLLSDNAILEGKDPDYRNKLMLLPLVERERLLKGNWKIRPSAGLKFPRDKWKILPGVPNGPWLSLVRFWDKAYTEGGHGAKTAGVLIGELADWQKSGLPRYVVLDCRSDRWGDAAREAEMRMTAYLDKSNFGHVRIGIEDEGGAGKQASRVSASNLAGFEVYLERPYAKKHLRWTPLAAQQQLGNVGIVDADWTADFIRELDALAGDESMDKGKLKDKADAAAGAFKGVAEPGFGKHTELICSGNGEDSGPMSGKEVEQLPDDLKELVNAYREMPPADRLSREDD